MSLLLILTFFVLKKFLISSSDLPFVSGNVNPINTAPNRAIVAKVKYDPLAPMLASKIGQHFTTRKENNQLNDAQNVDDEALASFENNSAFKTHGKGPIPRE